MKTLAAWALEVAANAIQSMVAMAMVSGQNNGKTFGRIFILSQDQLGIIEHKISEQNKCQHLIFSDSTPHADHDLQISLPNLGHPRRCWHFVTKCDADGTSR